jgi:hypothetical protein
MVEEEDSPLPEFPEDELELVSVGEAATLVVREGTTVTVSVKTEDEEVAVEEEEVVVAEEEEVVVVVEGLETVEEVKVLEMTVEVIKVTEDGCS